MNYNEAIAYIHGIYKRGKKDKLLRITELLERMGNPQKELKFVHVAGTNGKGSICVMLACMLRAAGFRVGLFTSPFIERFNERINIEGMPIQDAELAESVSRVAPFVEQMAVPPSEFELVTAVAIDAFRKAECEIVVWETGLGGRYDATNVVKNKLVEVIASIDYDHTRELGETLAEIAAHKSGIVLPGTMVVSCAQQPEALQVIEAECEKQGAQLFMALEQEIQPLGEDLSGQRFCYKGAQYRLALLGAHQLQNAATALRAAELLGQCGFTVSQQAAVEGMAQARWPGRFEVLSEQPVIIADGGHNPQGVRAACAAAKRVLQGQKITVVLGVMADKELGPMLESLNGIAARFIATAPDYPRALPADKLAQQLEPLGKPVEWFASVEQAVQRAAEYAFEENGAALCVGTLYMIGTVRAAGKAAGLALRDQRRAQLRRMSREYFAADLKKRAEISDEITRTVLQTPEYAAAKTVFAFVGTERELDTSALLQKILADGKRLCVPLCGAKGEMTARLLHGLDELRPGAYGILEPDSGCAIVPPQEIELGLIPCAVCDGSFGRVGKGGGYYDRYLVRSGMVRMVLCPQELVQERVPQEPHDQKMDLIITEKGVLRRGKTDFKV